MKKILIPTLLVLLAACSGEKAGSERIKYEKTGSNKAWQVGEAALRACKDEDAKKEPCATIQLKEGASIPPALMTSPCCTFTIRRLTRMTPLRRTKCVTTARFSRTKKMNPRFA